MTLCVLSLKQEAVQGPTKRNQATVQHKQSFKTKQYTTASDEHKKMKDERRIAAEKKHEILETGDATVERQLPNFDEEICNDFRYITGDEGSFSEDDDADTFPAYVPSFLNTSTPPVATSTTLEDFARDLLGRDEQGAEPGIENLLLKQGKVT